MLGKILIVDDEEDLRDVLREQLEAEGYAVACATNGKQALDLLRAEIDPCLVLLDLLMPVMSGWQFRGQQLLDPFLSRSPVIVMSATRTLEEAAINADGLLVKPLLVEELLATVARYCTPQFMDSSSGVPTAPQPHEDSGPQR